MTTCSYHPDEEAAAKCVECKKAVCDKCEVVIKGKSYCKPCVELMFGEKEPSEADAPLTPVSAGIAPPHAHAKQKPAAVTAATVEDTENTSGQGKGSAIPPEVRGWNWGAFLLNWIWGMGNSVWIALLTLVLGPIMSVILGIKGNEWAWRNKKWDSVEQFKKTQRVWSGAGIGLTCLSILLVVVMIIAASGKSTTKMLDWTAQGTIQEPLTANVNGQDVVLGSLDKQQVEVRLPGTAFQGPILVTVKNTTNAPAVPSTQFIPLGAPVEISAGEQPARLSDLATVTFKLDRAVIESNPDAGAYWVAHYTGGEWEYLEPDEVNLDQGTISVRMDNFSPISWGKIEVEEAIQQYTRSKAVAEWGQEQVNEKVDGAVRAMLNPLLDKCGFTEEGSKELVAKIFTDKEYSKLKEAIEKGNTGDISENLGTLVGSNLQVILESKKLDEIWIGKTQIVGPMGAVMEYKDQIKAAAQAFGNAAGGDYEEAASILVKDVATKFIEGSATPVKVVLALKGAGEDAAKFLNNRMFEQAYQVWATGSTTGMGTTQRWAYRDVKKGEFDAVWNQSDYVRRQLIDSYVKKGITDRGEAEKQARIDLQNQFIARQSREAGIAQKQRELDKIFGIFGKGSTEDSTLENFLFPLEKGFFGITAHVEIPPKEKLDELLKIVETIKRDTGTTTIGKNMGPGVLQEQDLLRLASALIKSRPTLYDPDFRSPEYLEALNRYIFSINAPPEILAGKGIPGKSYSFTAVSQTIDLSANYIWSYSYGGKQSAPVTTKTGTVNASFPSAGRYTLKCLAWWSDKQTGTQELERIEKVAEITFEILDPAELKISVSPAMPSGQGSADTSYTFTATGKAIPGDAKYTWALNYAGGDKVMSNDTSVITGALSWPGEYTLSCLAKWIEKPSSGPQVDREAKAPPLTFSIPLTISPNPLDGEAGNSYTFTIGNGDSPPDGAYYKWLKDGKEQTGKDAAITIAFTDKGTYILKAQLVANASGNIIAQGQAEAKIAAATPSPTPAPTREVPVPVNGSLTIGSVPAGADIYVDGRQLSYQTPHNFVNNVEAGTYSVGLRKSGYKDYSATAIVAAGRLTELWAKLEPIESKPTPTPTPPTPTPTPKPTSKPSIDGTYSDSWVAGNSGVPVSARVTIKGNTATAVINDGARGNFTLVGTKDPKDGSFSGSKDLPCLVNGVNVKGGCTIDFSCGAGDGYTTYFRYGALGGGDWRHQGSTLKKE